MGESASLPARQGSSALEPIRGSALDQVPRRQALWVGGQVVGAVGAAVTAIWLTQPELGLVLSLGLGASAVNPRKLWAAPLVVGAVLAAATPFMWLGLPAVIGAGFAAGAAATLLLPHRIDALDILNGGLATLAGASLGLWAATALIPGALPTVVSAALTAMVVGLVASQGLLPSALRFDRNIPLPSRSQVRRSLKVPYRPPVFRALDLYAQARHRAPERDMRRGLAEVATWVWRLQVTLQSLDEELTSIDVEDISARIDACAVDEDHADPFTRDRRAATAEHLKRLLSHRELIATEHSRTGAAVDYAIAYLEEARAGLAVAQKLPGEHAPNRLHEVLDKLRSHVEAGDARRRTARELDGF
ncbi:MAG: hypothetical protein ACI8PZ_001555 [Myxococcota bacterium]